jgi:hypothetical protein
LDAFSVDAKAASSPVPVAPDTYVTAAVVLTAGLDDSVSVDRGGKVREKMSGRIAVVR